MRFIYNIYFNAAQCIGISMPNVKIIIYIGRRCFIKMYNSCLYIVCMSYSYLGKFPEVVKRIFNKYMMRRTLI